MSYEEASRWPTLLRILEEKARPDRIDQKRAHLRERWWQFAETRPALRRAIAGKSRVLMHPFTSTFLAFVFVPANILIAGPHQVFALSLDCDFSILQSRVHEIWARFFGSSLEDRLRYTPSDCFVTFPFPKTWQNNPALETTGKVYYDFRGALMVKNDEGLTKTYNRFHDPDERDPAIIKLRELHAEMDRAVLAAYGWTDVKLPCEFILDYQEKEDEESGAHSRKKPWRYRWPDEIRDEVLARLLELNRQRALEEAVAGEAQTSSGRPKPSRGRSGRSKDTVEPPLVPSLLREEKQ
jgi:hypothetical protein